MTKRKVRKSTKKKREESIFFTGMMTTLNHAADVLGRDWNFSDKDQGIFITKTAAQIIRSVGGNPEHTEKAIRDWELEQKKES